MDKWDILILDRSASMLVNMHNLRKGFDNLIKEQIENKSKSRLTVIGFNNVVEIIKDEYFPNVSKIDEEHYYARGLTSLLDAVGNAYDLILGDKNIENITLTVITDGLENSSQYYTVGMLDKKKKEIDETKNLKFIFLGSDISCINGNVINPHVSQTVNYRGDIIEAMRTASYCISHGRASSEDMQNVNPENFNETSHKREHSLIDGPLYLNSNKKLCSKDHESKA